MSWPWRRSRQAAGPVTRESISETELGRSPPQRKLGLDSLLFFGVRLAQFLETGNLGLSEGLVGEVGERLTPPEAQGCGELRGARRRFELGRTGEPSLEVGAVEPDVRRVEPVAVGFGHDRIRPQHLAQVCDVPLDRRLRPTGRPVGPQRLDQRVGGDRAGRSRPRAGRARRAAWRPSDTAAPSRCAASGPRIPSSMPPPAAIRQCDRR